MLHARTLISEALIKSLDVPNSEIEESWAIEAERRLKVYKAGKLQTISFKDMFGRESA